MKITEKQIHQLFLISFGSTSIGSSIGGYNQETRLQIINNIMSQQSDNLMDTRDFEIMKLALDQPEEDGDE